jgi:hypothetical protein
MNRPLDDETNATFHNRQKSATTNHSASSSKAAAHRRRPAKNSHLEIGSKLASDAAGILALSGLPAAIWQV